MQHNYIRHLIIICILTLAVLTLSVPAFAAGTETGTGTITVDSVSAKSGETADVAVRVENNPGIVTVLLKIDYDSSVLTLTGAENGEVFADDTAIFGNDLTMNPYTVLWEDGLSTENHTADGVLVILHFAVKADAPAGDYAIGLEIDESSTFNTDLQTVAFQLQNGAVRIEPARTPRHTDVLIAGIAVAVVACLTVVGTVFAARRRKRAANG